MNDLPQKIDELIEVVQNGGGLVDWVQAERFEQITGIRKSSLRGKHEMWPEGIVWAKFDDGRLYYSIGGYNKWAAQQAIKRCPQGLSSETGQSASGGCGIKPAAGKRLKKPRSQSLASPPRLLSEVS